MKFKSFSETHDAEEGFFRNLMDNPKDTSILLVWADWLEERGDNKRAEIIRLITDLAEKGDKGHLDRLEQLTGKRGYELIGEVRNLIFGIYRWMMEHPVVQRTLLSRLPPLNEEILARVLPHGSGINGQWRIRETPKDWRCTNFFEARYESGAHLDDIDFWLIIPKDDPLKFVVEYEDGVAAQFMRDEGYGQYVKHVIHLALVEYFKGGK